MQLITIFFWIVAIIIMKSTTTVICKTNKQIEQQQQQQQKLMQHQNQKYLLKADNRILSGFPEFLMEIQRNSNNKINNNNKNDYNKNNNYMQNDAFIRNTNSINGLTTGHNVIEQTNTNNDEINYDDVSDMNINDDAFISDKYHNLIDNNINNEINSYEDIGHANIMLGSSSRNTYRNNLKYDNLNMCKNTLQRALADYDEMEEVLKNINTKSGKFDQTNVQNTSDIIRMIDKRGNIANGPGCDCQIKNDLIDLGYPHYPRYLFNAVCQEGISNPSVGSGGINLDEHRVHTKRCWRGSQCKPVEYKVRVLTYRTRADNMEKDYTMSLLPDVLRSDWKWKTITVAAGCFCSY